MVCSAQTMHLSCQDYNYPQTDQNKLPLNIHYIGVPSGVPKAISTPVVHSTQIVHFSCAEIRTISKQIKMSFCLIHVTLECNQVRPK
jgi:hypothetical protein